MKPFTVGPWRVHPTEGTLTRGDEQRRLQPKVMQVLLCLVRRPGQLLTREELLQDVWGDRAVSDEPLTRCIAELRKALGDSGGDQAFVETFPKRGYRLVAPVGLPDAAEHDRVTGDTSSTGVLPTRRKVRPLTLGVAGAVLLALFLVIFPPRPDERTDGGDTAVTLQPRPSTAIVVLPFTDLSADGTEAYFADGISEELTGLLARVPGLRVISRRSAFSFRGQNVGMQTIVERLGVTHVLEGSVRRDGDDVRIAAQLIDARADDHLWSETYERTLDDIFDTQEEIAVRVVEQLRITLLGDAPTVPADDPEAYALVLRARYLSGQLAPGSMANAGTLFREALAIDPDYAAAWTGLANVYMRQVGQGLLPNDTGYDMARSAAAKALEIDPNNAEALRSLAWIAQVHEKNIAAAARYYERALNIEPTNVAGAAHLAAGLGRLDLAITLQEYDNARDPVSAVGTTNLGLYLQRAGRFDEAIDSLRTTLALSPDYIGAHYFLGTSLLLNGAFESALEEMRRETFEVYRLLGLVTTHHALGEQALSDEALDALIAGYEHEWAYNIAYVLAYRGEADRAFEWLEKAVAYNDPGLAEIAAQPLFSNIESDPRWLPFLERVGKSPEQLAAVRLEVQLPE